MPDVIQDPCEICGETAESIPANGDVLHQHCDRCGEFILSGSAMSLVRNLSRPDKTKLARAVRRANIAAVVPTITSNNLSEFFPTSPPSALKLADDVLVYLSKKSDRLTHFIELSDKMADLMALAHARDARDVNVLIADLLAEPGFLRKISSDGEPLKYRLTRDGYARLDELQRKGADSAQAFVAMCFGRGDRREFMDAVYAEGLAKGIRLAGYKPHRVDKGEYNGKIDDEIIRQIRRSRFLVADFTDHVAGVYYETGFAEGLGMPIIQTCHQSQIGGLHFDNRQINTIAWENSDQLAEQLQRRIEGTLGKGPLRA